MLLTAVLAAVEDYSLPADLLLLEQDLDDAEYATMLREMPVEELNHEWHRLYSSDGSLEFALTHGGTDVVMASTVLRTAYMRRKNLEDRFRNRMRKEFKRFNWDAPFDTGHTAPVSGTTSNPIRASIEKHELKVYTHCDNAMNWPQFRGPGGQGQAVGKAIPCKWSLKNNLLWRVSVKRGNSSPICWEDKLFLTEATEDGLSREVTCRDRATGDMLWTQSFGVPQSERNVQDKNGFVSPTPVADSECVYAFLGNAGLVAIGHDGSVKWRMPLNVDCTYGVASSPVLFNDLIILIQDQDNTDSLFFAADKTTGVVRWTQERPNGKGWSTPTIVEVNGRYEMIFAGLEAVRGYSPENGDELWVINGLGAEVIPTIVAGTDMLFAASGRLGPMIGFLPNGQGNVTDSHTMWTAVRAGPFVPSAVLASNRIFVVNDNGIVKCIRADNGHIEWRSRLHGRFSASPIHSDGNLFFFDEYGKVFVLRASDRFELIAQNDVGEQVLATPAAVDGILYVRTSESLMAISDHN